MAAACFLLFTYVFLLDQTNYLNHFYLLSIMLGLLTVVPGGACLSVDAWLRRSRGPWRVHAWAVWLLRLQLGIVYFLAGVAKLNRDWLGGEPMRTWLGNRARNPELLGPLTRPLSGFFEQEWCVQFFSYGGLLFDLLVVPMLLWRRTRMLGFCLAVAFHVMNADLFSIGIFPWYMIGATTIFFAPAWPRSFLGRKKLLPAAGGTAGRQRWILGLVAAWLLFQLLFPFRHIFYPGHPSWSEEGHRFAWHMKLKQKDAIRFSITATDPESGEAFVLRRVRYPEDGTKRIYLRMTFRPPGEEERIVADKAFLQVRQVSKMSTRPHLVRQFARYFEKCLQGGRGVEGSGGQGGGCVRPERKRGAAVDRPRSRSHRSDLGLGAGNMDPAHAPPRRGRPRAYEMKRIV